MSFRFFPVLIPALPLAIWGDWTAHTRLSPFGGAGPHPPPRQQTPRLFASMLLLYLRIRRRGSKPPHLGQIMVQIIHILYFRRSAMLWARASMGVCIL